MKVSNRPRGGPVYDPDRDSIPPEDLAILQEEQYTHPLPRVQRKLHTLYLVGLGYPRHEVARMIGVSAGTVRRALHAYAARGREALRHTILTPIPTRRPW